MKKYLLASACALLGQATAAYGQQVTSAMIEGQTITVKYSPPVAKTRAAGAFHTDADLAFK